MIRHILLRFFQFYLFTLAVLLHVAVLYLYFAQPALFWRVADLIALSAPQIVTSTAAPTTSQYDDILQAEPDLVAGRWQPLASESPESTEGVWLDGVSYSSLTAAAKKLKDGSHLRLGAGIYRTALNIHQHDVVIEGVGHVVFEQAVSDGKAAIVARGDNLMIKNIECRHIKVPSKNGACVRLEGRGLTLEHVYFHSSETALLETAKQHGYITIRDSRFENLAANARAHSIYLNSASLYFTDSVILANRNQHSLKSRGPLTIIENSIIAELSAPGSRLIDISNGGELIIKGSILQQGPNAVNNQAIGFGLEGVKHAENSIRLTDNVILLERRQSNILLYTGTHSPAHEITGNLIIGANDSYPENLQLTDRQSAAMPAAPALPAVLCHLHLCQPDKAAQLHPVANHDRKRQ